MLIKCKLKIEEKTKGIIKNILSSTNTKFKYIIQGNSIISLNASNFDGADVLKDINSIIYRINKAIPQTAKYGSFITKNTSTTIPSINISIPSQYLRDAEKQLELEEERMEIFKLPNTSPQINYTFKAVEILNSERGKQIFDKGAKNNWSLDKILTELAIPKEQKQLLLDLNIQDREQLALEFANQFSYIVETNITKEKFITNEYNSETDQFEDRDYGTENTDFYQNLSVPGGTNYTENEILTPEIIPSIKGHAQFATDNGIGWFRQDDRLVNFSKMLESGLIKQVNC